MTRSDKVNIYGIIILIIFTVVGVLELFRYPELSNDFDKNTNKNKALIQITKPITMEDIRNNKNYKAN